MRQNRQQWISNQSTINTQRCMFNLSHTLKTMYNTGDLVPVLQHQVNPGETFTVNISDVTRASTPLAPVMDVGYSDYYAFFVPWRLVWDNTEEFFGENKKEKWEQTQLYTIPTVTAGAGLNHLNSALHHLSLPLNLYGEASKVSILPLRAYTLIWNEWFRDQNWQDPKLIDKSSGNFGSTTVKQLTDDFGNLLKSNIFHDYISSCLPDITKGKAGIISAAPDTLIKVGALRNVHDFSKRELSFDGVSSDASVLYIRPDVQFNRSDAFYDKKNTIEPHRETLKRAVPINLWGDLSNVKLTTLQSLRQDIVFNQLLERDARGGTRYPEHNLVHFGVESSDARLQRPELLGHLRLDIHTNQVINTADNLGQTGAYTLNSATGDLFSKSFTEHGHIIILKTTRVLQSYQDAINRIDKKKTRFEFLYPELAQLSEQPVYNYEVTGRHLNPDNVWGFQERYAEYKYLPNRIKGAFSSSFNESLDFWHYGRDFGDSSNVVMGNSFLKQTETEVDRTLAVSSKLAQQWQSDIYIGITAVRPLPLYSVPGVGRI